jgi:hypothetical protein
LKRSKEARERGVYARNINVEDSLEILYGAQASRDFGPIEIGMELLRGKIRTFK